MSQPDNSKLATASSPIRMRVQGMDCAKDAAEIERAARSAGVAEGDVKVSAATHIMTLRIADGDLPKVRPALDACLARFFPRAAQARAANVIGSEP